MEFHVVSKSNNRVHKTVSVDKSTYPELSPDTVRVQPVVLSLASNNLSYARLGHFLNWWNAYPVPQSAPEPYNDNTQWGIVPTWGYGIIVESKIASLRPGTLLFGYWPMASAPVDLKLAGTGLDGHWAEVSEHREKVMPLYNEYQAKGYHEIPIDTAVGFTEEQLSQMAWFSLFGAIWQTGYLLNRYTFTSNPSIHLPIGPMGYKTSHWSDFDRDLSQAVLVSLSASSKTARGFAWQILNKRAPDTGPLAFLQVTQVRDVIQDVASPHAHISSEVFDYSQMKNAVKLMSDFNLQKVIIVDFGGRDGALEKFVTIMQKKEKLQGVKPVVIYVGQEQKIFPPDGRGSSFQSLKHASPVVCNTADIRDEVIAKIGRQAYYDDLQANWEEWVNDRERNIPDLKLMWGRSVSGEQGIEAGWDRLADGNVAPEEGLVYRMW